MSETDILRDAVERGSKNDEGTVCANCRRPMEEHEPSGWLGLTLRCPVGDDKYCSIYGDDGSIDTEYQDYPRCPHCGHDHVDVCDWFSELFGEDGDRTEADCERCGKAFDTELHVSYNYTSRKRATDGRGERLGDEAVAETEEGA